ncbi:MAG: arsenate reductase (azurin) large subunit [Gammaproteobacteria bacterium]|nr:arsenate reductase (azurin) large subunit [Gammaproteobacteria bacterium]
MEKYEEHNDHVPLPPKDAEVFTTACEYCVVACGYKVYRWPVGKEGGPTAGENALKADYPVAMMSGKWISPNQHNVVSVNGKPHHIAVIPDSEIQVVNVGGDHSIRGGTIAKKCYNPDSLTSDRLLYPMVRVDGKLQRVSWDVALDLVANISRYVIDKHGEDAWAMKMFSYQYFENTYALTKLALRDVRTAAFAVHDQPTGAGSDTPGMTDAGIEPFSSSYEDMSIADTLFLSGTDPFETKTIVFNEWIMKGIRNGMKVIYVLPRKTTGVAFAEKNGGMLLQVIPGTDTILQLAIARVIVENGWEDKDFLRDHINNRAESDTETFQADGFDDYKRWLLSVPYAKLDEAVRVTGVPAEKIRLAAEWMAKPKADGTRPKTSINFEKGNYWSNNYLNTASLASLGLICGAGNRPGQVISRLGGHQRGMMEGGNYPWEKVAEKFPGRLKKPVDLDRWMEMGKARFTYVVGTTWVQAMTASSGLRESLQKLTRGNPHQPTSLDPAHLLAVLKQRVDSGGMVLVDQDIYPVAPVGTEFADIVLPASGWGEQDLTRANGERRIRLYSKFYDAPGEAKADWWIAAQIGKRMGYSGFDWKDSNEIFEEAAWHGRSGVTSYLQLVEFAKTHGKSGHQMLREFGTTGIQAPVRWEDGKLVGTQRLQDSTLKLGTPMGATPFTGNILRFFGTTSGKANLLKTPWELFADFYEHIKPQDDELWVTTGRINEFWQSGFDDKKRREYQKQRWPHNFIELHPDDAKARGIESGDMLLVWSDRVPVQTGGFMEYSEEARGVVRVEDGDKSVQSDPLFDTFGGPASVGENLSADQVDDAVQDDTLLATVRKAESLEIRPLDREPTAAEAIRVGWDDVEPMTFSALQKAGHIKHIHGDFRAVALVTDAIRPGVAFTYFLDTENPGNSLAPRVLDPVSQRYRFKLGVGRLKKLGESEYKNDFTRMSLAPRHIV